MHAHQKGMALSELLIVMMLIAVLAALCSPFLLTMIHNEKSRALKIQLKQAIIFAKQLAITSHDTLAFCVGHDHHCFAKPTTNGLIYVDSFQDGVLHHPAQLKQIIPLPKASGELMLRTFPRYRNAILFHADDRLLSDNGTFWFCANNKPVWAITINRIAAINEVAPNNAGTILDHQGRPLEC